MMFGIPMLYNTINLKFCNYTKFFRVPKRDYGVNIKYCDWNENMNMIIAYYNAYTIALNQNVLTEII